MLLVKSRCDAGFCSVDPLQRASKLRAQRIVFDVFIVLTLQSARKIAPIPY
jgi:hypothetical protein